VDPEKVETHYDKGVLKVQLPKKAGSQADQKLTSAAKSTWAKGKQAA
jgi:HSP20 family molecular chaperone IbpA